MYTCICCSKLKRYVCDQLNTLEHERPEKTQITMQFDVGSSEYFSDYIDKVFSQVMYCGQKSISAKESSHGKHSPKKSHGQKG